MTFTVLM